jgi:hypothetical protein
MQTWLYKIEREAVRNYNDEYGGEFIGKLRGNYVYVLAESSDVAFEQLPANGYKPLYVDGKCKIETVWPMEFLKGCQRRIIVSPKAKKVRARYKDIASAAKIEFDAEYDHYRIS